MSPPDSDRTSLAVNKQPSAASTCFAPQQVSLQRRCATHAERLRSSMTMLRTVAEQRAKLHNTLRSSDGVQVIVSVAVSVITSTRLTHPI